MSTILLITPVLFLGTAFWQMLVLANQPRSGVERAVGRIVLLFLGALITAILAGLKELGAF
jgi:hypothetical protein